MRERLFIRDVSLIIGKVLGRRMSEVNSGDVMAAPVATGGKVWAPKQEAPKSIPHKLLAISPFFSPFLVILVLGVMLCVMAVETIKSASQPNLEAQEMRQKLANWSEESKNNNTKFENTFAQWAEQEYGYSIVEGSVLVDDSVLIRNAEGEENEISVIRYDGIPIVYEDGSELVERISSVDGGTYSEEVAEAYQEWLKVVEKNEADGEELKKLLSE